MRAFILAALGFLPALGCNDKGDDSSGEESDADTDADSDADSDADADTDTDTDIPEAECIDEGGACVLTGTYTESMRLTADKNWLLRSGVLIGDDSADVTLEIEPGTTVYGESASNGLMIITRGAKIDAQGTASSPIVFTSDQAPGSRARGDWGGLVLNGRGWLNICDTYPDTPCEAKGEGNTGMYGGDDDNDNSGILKYVVVEFGGTEISTDNEINGISVQGVGDGTVIDYVQIHNTLDDCIEFWGGTVNASHIVCTSPGDDGIDWDLGWRGKMQFAVVQQGLGTGNNGIEADNAPEAYNSEPLTHPTISEHHAHRRRIREGRQLRRAAPPRHAREPHEHRRAVVPGRVPVAPRCRGVRGVRERLVDRPHGPGVRHGIREEQRGHPGDLRSRDGQLDRGRSRNQGSDELRVARTGRSSRARRSSPAAPRRRTTCSRRRTYIGAFDASNDWTSGWTHHDAD